MPQQRESKMKMRLATMAAVLLVILALGITNPIALAIDGDLTGDGKVDILDMTVVAAAFGSILGDPDYNATADFDANSLIDIFDLAYVAIRFTG